MSFGFIIVSAVFGAVFIIITELKVKQWIVLILKKKILQDAEPKLFVDSPNVAIQTYVYFFVL